MAFTIQNWARSSVSMNEPIQSVTDTAVSASPVIEGCFREYNYYSPVDTQATCAASGYFNAGTADQGVVFDLVVGDLIKVYSLTENSLVTYIVTSVTAGVVTVAVIGAAIERFVVTLTAAQFIAGYAAPILIAPAPGTNFMYTDVSAQFLDTYGSAQFTTGGSVGIQYGNTANLAGTLATSTVTNTEVNGIAANSIFSLIPATVVPTAKASIANAGLYLSNDTAAFAAGTGAIIRVNVNARLVSLV